MKTNNLKIFFAPIGGSMKFKKDAIKRFDGTEEYYKILYALVRNSSISEVWVIQKSDWNKLNDLEKIEFDPRGVLIDVYSDFTNEGFSRDSVRPKDMFNIQSSIAYKELAVFLNNQNVKFDFGIGIMGMGFFTNTNIPNFLGSSRGEKVIVKVRWATYNYCSPIIHFLNQNYKPNVEICKNSTTGDTLPWFLITQDPRYVKKRMRMRDTFNTPKEIIAQFDELDTVWESYDTYKDNFGKNDGETIKKTPLRYSGIEKAARINEKIYPPTNERNTKFMIVAMQSSYGQFATSDKRLDMLNEYILKYDDKKEVEIYGKWNEHFMKQFQQIKGFIDSSKIDEKLRDTRYTLAVPIGNDWVTAKYADIIAQGTLPFFAKNYDTQYHLVPKDHFIRVKDGKDLAGKMEFLDKNPKQRHKLIMTLQQHWLTNVKKGHFIYNIFNTSLQNFNIPVRLSNTIDETIKRKTAVKTLF